MTVETDDACPMCDAEMEKGELDGNWREYTCPACGAEVLRPVASDHGDGMSMEDLSNISEFNSE